MFEKKSRPDCSRHHQQNEDVSQRLVKSSSMQKIKTAHIFAEKNEKLLHCKSFSVFILSEMVEILHRVCLKL